VERRQWKDERRKKKEERGEWRVGEWEIGARGVHLEK
jgi:hypothetical protein